MMRNGRLIEWCNDFRRHTSSPLAAIAYGKLSLHVLFKFGRPRLNRKLFSRYAAYLSPSVLTRSRASPSALAGGWCVSLLFGTNGTAVPRLRNFDTEPHPHIATSPNPTIAWKASPTRTPPPICTSAPYLKPRWSQSRRRRERSYMYSMPYFPQRK